MLKKIFGASLIFALSVLSVHETRAQADEKKFEVGGQFSLLRLPTRTITTTTFPCIGPLPCPVQTNVAIGHESEPGVGGRFGFNFSKYVGIEAEVNFFPRDRNFEGGRKIEGLFGAKVGKRFDSFGLFAKARPGFERSSRGDFKPVGGCPAVFPPPIGCFQSFAKTNLAFDVGAVAEWYPSKNTIIRFDAGDTIIRFGRHNAAAFDVPAGGLGPVRLVVVPVATETKHNFQGSIGVGFRF